jgi:hypothetical protein
MKCSGESSPERVLASSALMVGENFRFAAPEFHQKMVALERLPEVRISTNSSR